MQFGDELEDIVLQFPNEAVAEKGTEEYGSHWKTGQEFAFFVPVLYGNMNVLWICLFLEMMASSNTVFVYAKLTKLKDYTVIYFTCQMTFLRDLEWLVLHVEIWKEGDSICGKSTSIYRDQYHLGNSINST